MARFYGQVQGNRGGASRLGHAQGGLYVSAQSYTGSVIVTLSDLDGEDCVRIAVAKGSRASGDRTLYHGSIANLLGMLQRNSDMLLVPASVEE